MQDSNTKEFRNPYKYLVMGILILATLFVIKSQENEVLLSLPDILSLIISGGIFMVTWHTRKLTKNNYFVFLGIALLFVGIFDLLHVLISYGINTIDKDSPNLPSQFWLTARFMQSIAFLAAPYFLIRETRARYIILMFSTISVLAGISMLINSSVARLIGFNLGAGVLINRIAATIIVSIMFAAFIRMTRVKSSFDPHIASCISYSVLSLAAALFTVSVNPDHFSYTGITGHFLSLVSLIFVYRAIVTIGLEYPYRVLFRDLKKRELELLENEEKLRRILESNMDGIVIVNSDRVVEFANPAAQEILGIKEEELGKISATDKRWKITDFAGNPVQNNHGAGEQVLKTGVSAQGIEGLVHRNDGAIFAVSMNIAAFKDSNGNVIGNVQSIRDITKQRAAQNQLLQLSKAVDQSTSAVVITDTDGIIEYINCKFEQQTGYTQKEVIGKNFGVLKSGIMPAEHFAQLWETIKSGEEWHGEQYNYKKSGELYWESESISPILGSNGNITHFLAIKEDITEIKRAEEALRESKEQMELLYRVIPSAVFTVDEAGIVTTFNRKAEEITGYKAHEIIGKSCKIFSLEPCNNDCLRNNNGIEKPIENQECNIRRKDGQLVLVSKNIDVIKDLDGNILGGVESFEDITVRKKNEEALNYMAFYDTLSGLPNRTLLNDRLERAVAYAERNSRILSVMYLDIDNFKNINDTLGHSQGDELLKQVANRLQGCIRKSDTAARLGGDEFVLVLPEITQLESIIQIANNVLEAIRQPFKIESTEVYVTTSMGISVYPYDGLTAGVLLRNADTALYKAKEMGKNNFQYYSTNMDDDLLTRFNLSNDLRRAVEREEFVLYYQPQVDLTSGEIVAMEALIRWEHPELGLIQPAEFIHLAEETGLIMPIGTWVLNTACKQNKCWQEEGYPPIRVSVNISARQIQQQDFIEVINMALKDSGLDPAYLELEITESVLMKDKEVAAETLTKLKDMGIQITIDDFGTGYSSLSYLKQFPIEKLKIDQLFVRTLVSDPNDAAIVGSIISMAHNLRMKAVAEGVETNEQMELLNSLKCGEMQGFLFSKPLPAAEVAEFLTQKGLKPKKKTPRKKTA